MLEMAARVRSRFIARDYSWAIALGTHTERHFAALFGIRIEIGIALR
jgi:hypothetical protein